MGVERLLDAIPKRKKPTAPGACDDVTAVIKTFERPAKLKRLLKSMARTFPDLKIIIIDDSKEPGRYEGENIETIVLPYDSGLSAGRMAGLERVKTPYFLLLDDDFIFSRKTDILRGIQYLDNTPEVDLVAGEVTYLPFYIRHDYSYHQLMAYNQPATYPKGTLINGLKVYEKVPNFFVARVEPIKRVGWDVRLKKMEHADFFTRARGKLTCVMDLRIEVLHDPSHFDRNYLKKRLDVATESRILAIRYRKR